MADMKKVGKIEMTPEGLRKLAAALEIIHPGQKCNIGVWG